MHFQPIGIARQLNAGDREFAESGILKTHVLFVRKSERTASRVGRVSPVFGNRTVTNAVKWEVKNGKTGSVYRGWGAAQESHAGGADWGRLYI